MGVNLSVIVPSKKIEISDLSGKTIAIDAYNTLYQFLSIIRDRFTGEPLRDSKGRVTSHISGLFYRTAKLMEAGVDPVFVFDGKPPAFKKATTESRMEVKKQAEEKLEDARERGDVDAIRRYAQATSRIDKDMVENSKRLLEYMGVPVIQAPSEGEAQAAHMVKTGKVWAAGSQDWDSLLFGAGRMVKNITITGRRKVPRKEDYIEVKPEVIELETVLSSLGLSRDQMIMLGMLIGTDYNPGGVKGIGPKNALKIVKEHGNFENVFKNVEWGSETSPEEIFEFFRKPPVEDVEIERKKPNFEELQGFMTEFDFSEERTEKNIERLKNMKKNESLHKWFR
jgi:flap endonuclease-1